MQLHHWDFRFFFFFFFFSPFPVDPWLDPPTLVPRRYRKKRVAVVHAGVNPLIGMPRVSFSLRYRLHTAFELTSLRFVLSSRTVTTTPTETPTRWPYVKVSWHTLTLRFPPANNGLLYCVSRRREIKVVCWLPDYAIRLSYRTNMKCDSFERPRLRFFLRCPC